MAGGEFGGWFEQKGNMVHVRVMGEGEGDASRLSCMS